MILVNNDNIKWKDKDDILGKDIKIDDKRIINIKSIFFENGCFIIISENSR